MKRLGRNKPSTDRSVFKNTSRSTKTINFKRSNGHQRGGFRL